MSILAKVISKNMLQLFSSTELSNLNIHRYAWGRCGRDRMVVGFTTTYAISAYHH
jgi:hypothetical protein